MSENFADAILSLPSIINYSVSKDGKKIGLTWYNIHKNADIFYIDIEEKKEPLVLSHTPEFTVVKDFFPNSPAIIVSEDVERNEHNALYKIDLNFPEKMTRMTEYNPPYFLRGGEIDKTEKWLIYATNYDFENKKIIEPSWVYKQNINDKTPIVLAKPEKPNYVVPSLNRASSFILYDRKDLHPKGNQYWLVDIEGKEDREILNFGAKARVYAEWLPDNERIVFMTDFKGGKSQNYYSVGIINITTNEINWVLDDPSRNIESLHVSEFGNKILIYQSEKARTKTTIIDADTLELTEFPKIEGNLIPRSKSYDEKWIGLQYSSQQPMDIVSFDFDESGVHSIVSLTKVWDKTSLTPEDLTKAEDFEWRGNDGLLIHGWLYRPKKWNNKTIVHVHGGPTSHSRDSINPQIQYLVNKGFIVLDPNYRGSTGYSYDFEDKIREHGWGSDEQQDIWNGIKEMIKKGLAKPGHVGITGTSYGGYSSWFGITKAPKDIIAAAVPICGMTDLVVDYYTTRPDLRPYSEEMMGGKPDDIPEIYFERSPINFISNIKGKKLLIVQGARDPNVTPKNVDAVKQELEKNNIDYELLIFKDEGHGILRKENKKKLYEIIADFFDRSL